MLHRRVTETPGWVRIHVPSRSRVKVFSCLETDQENPRGKETERQWGAYWVGAKKEQEHTERRQETQRKEDTERDRVIEGRESTGL